ncbi:unnamed protein product [Victoria cruziana]
MHRLEDRLHAIEGSGNPVPFLPERRPRELPAKTKRTMEFVRDEDTKDLDPGFLSLRSPHSDDSLTDAKACTLVPVPPALLATMESRTLALQAKRKKVVGYFRNGEDMGKLHPGFLSLWSPRSGVSDKNSAGSEAPRIHPSEGGRLPRETAMAELPSLILKMMGRQEEEGIAPGTPSTCAFECKICGKSFSTCQALGGHTTGHMRSRRAGEDGDRKPASTRPAAAAPRHQCSICGRCFASGQALGGHKRLHRDKDVGRLLRRQIGVRLLGFISMGFDLNQPPPQ